MALETYFSHSWAAKDVDLNVLVWATMADECVVYVDREGAAGGAYYINRIEERIRKSDVFVSALAYRENDNATRLDLRPDYGLSCSAGTLFEIRLAERARKPRWIVYDDRTGFCPVEGGNELVSYTPITTDEELHRGGVTIREEGRRWLQRVRGAFSGSPTRRPRRAALLIDDTATDAAEVRSKVEVALRRAGYNQVVAIEQIHTDAEVIASLQSCGLLVAEITERSVGDVYAMAHGMFVPTIRFIRASQQLTDVPRLLDGHPGGYQHDLILVESTSVLATEVAKRAEAMRDDRGPISGLASGCAYLRRYLHRPHRVFFSHNLDTIEAEVLRLVFERLESLGIRAWEYRHRNQAGVVWRTELDLALADATDVVFIFSKDYELSPACSDELRYTLQRGDTIKGIIPFLWGSRDRPNPQLSTRHHEKLPTDPTAAAEVIVDRVAKMLRIPVNEVGANLGSS